MRDEWSQTQSFVTFNLAATSSAVRRGSFEGLRPTVRGGVSASMLKPPGAGLVSETDSNLPGCSPELWSRRRPDPDCEFDIAAPANKHLIRGCMTGMPFKSFHEFGQTELNPYSPRRSSRSIPSHWRRTAEVQKTVLRTPTTSDLTEIPIRLNFFTNHG